MKDFDLKAAKAGAAVCIRSGENARIICYDKKDITPCLNNRIIYLADYDGCERMYSCCSDGRYTACGEDEADLMMRDDDYAEKLARGEYGNHIHEATEKVDPTIKENLTVDRERLRRELSEKIMVAMIRELAGKSPHSTSSNITVYEAMAADAVSYADALLEELEKTEKK
jgi:hypothetical protein